MILLRFACARDKPVVPPTGGEPGDAGRGPIDCLLRLVTMLLTAPPPLARGDRARRGPRMRGSVGVPTGGDNGFVGEGLREDVVDTDEGGRARGELGRLPLPERRVAGMAVAGLRVSASGVGGEKVGTGANTSGWGSENVGMGGGEAGSGGGSLKLGRVGRSSVSGGGSLNVG